jgi:hypothetical protein
MCRDLLAARQGDDEKIRNFIRRVTRLSKRLGDVSSRQIVQIVWDGALSYFRLKWADTGLDFETASLSALETATKGYEAAETIRRIAAAKRAAEAASAMPMGSNSSATKSSGSGTSLSTTTKRSRLTDEEQHRFRSEVRCFHCRETGHQKRNCPSKHQAPAPKIRSGAVTVPDDPYAYLKNIGVYG